MPTVEAIQGTLKTATSNTIELAAPAGIVDGELILIFACKVAQTGAGLGKTYSPAVTKLYEENLAEGGGGRWTMGWRIASGEAGTYDVTFTSGDTVADMWGWVARISDVDQVAPVGAQSAVATQFDNPGPSTVLCPSINTAVNNSLILRACFSVWNSITGLAQTSGPAATETIQSPNVSVRMAALYTETALVSGATGTFGIITQGGNGASGIDGVTLAISPPSGYPGNRQVFRERRRWY